MGIGGTAELLDQCHGSDSFTALCVSEGLRRSFTRPCTPQADGKVKRFIQMMKRRWAYRFVFRTSTIRAASSLV